MADDGDEKKAKRARLGLVAAVAVVGAAALFSLSWLQAEPEIYTYCGGLLGENVERDNGREPATGPGPEGDIGLYDEIGDRFGVVFCPDSSDDIEILSVALGTGRQDAYQLVGTEFADARESVGTGVAGPMEPLTVGPGHEIPINGILWLEVQKCAAGPSEYSGIGGVTVEYKYRGRTRTQLVRLMNPASFTTEIDCGAGGDDSLRAQEALEDSLWQAASSDHPKIRAFDVDLVNAEDNPTITIGRDLCLYLDGPKPLPGFGEIESIENRRVFNLDNEELTSEIIRASLDTICPEYADQEADLLALAAD